jgi:glycosyltransferase involved in cell wall biosynthesis
MKILALHAFLPYPTISGATLRSASILNILASRHEVTLVSGVGSRDSPSELPAWKTYKRLAREPLLVSRKTDEELSPAGAALRKLLPQSRIGFPELLTYFDSPAMWNRIAELDLQQFDAIHIRYASMALYALALKRAFPNLRIVIDLDDIPTVFLMRRLAFPRNITQLRQSAWQVRQLVRTYAFECTSLREFDSVWICSKVDLYKIEKRIGRGRALIVENVVDAQELASIARQNKEPALLFIGDFTYGPNQEGAEFFTTKVWTKIRSMVPTAQLWLVGANENAGLQQRHGQDGITVTGAVDSVRPYLAQAAISIAPLITGTGTRLKILEALAAGLPVVSTSIGAEGIEGEAGVDLMIADTADNFANCCVQLLQDPALAERLKESGQRLIMKKYDIPVMSRAVLRCYDLLEIRPS